LDHIQASVRSVYNEGRSRMAVAHAMWIHGHSMQIEDPDGLRSIYRSGASIRVEGEQDATHWFQFAVPTPAVMGDETLRVAFVMLRFNLGGSTRIRQVHAYDGERRIAEFNDLPTVPRGRWHTEWYRVPDHPEILHGLGISVMVHFLGVPVIEDSHCVQFSSAGMWYSYEEMSAAYKPPLQSLEP
jgi:hypothetical protein